MDNQTIIQTMWSIFGAMGIALLSFIGWGLKKLVTTTFENTVAIKLLDSHIEKLIKGYAKIEKLETDINQAHSRIRQLKEQ